MTFQLLGQQRHHSCGDAPTAIVAVGPDIDNIGIADAVGQGANLADDPLSVAGKDNDGAVLERAAQFVGRAAVAEVIGFEVDRQLYPIHTICCCAEDKIHLAAPVEQ